MKLSFGTQCLITAFAISSMAPACIAGERRAINVHGKENNFDAPAERAQAESPLETLNFGFTAPAATSKTVPASAANQIPIKDIKVNANTAFSRTELDEVLDPYRNRSVSVEDISELRLRLSEAYLRKGYVSSGVLVPSQDLETGILQLTAIEGQLGDVVVASGSGLRDRYVSSRINRYVNGPLNINDLRVALEQLQQDANIGRIDARLVPTQNYGGSSLELSIVPEDRFEVRMGADNHRAISVGEERAFISTTARNLSGWGETITAYASTSEGGENYSGSLDVPLGPRFSVNFYLGDSDAEVIEEQLANLDIVSKFKVRGASVGYSLLDSPQRTFGLSIGWEKKDAESTLQGLPYSLSPGAVDGESSTRSLIAGIDYSRRRASNVVALRATYRHGLGRNGATEFNPAPGDTLALLQNPTGADGRYELRLYQAVLVQRLNVLPELAGLNDRAQLVMRATLQRASDPLMSLEKLAIGGANSVRGFRENLLVRDNGTALRFELQLPITGYSSAPGWRNLIVTPFLDYGRAYDVVNSNSFSSSGDTTVDAIIVSAGIGLVWEPLRGLRTSLHWGESINEKLPVQLAAASGGGSLQGDGIHASLSYSLTF